MLNVFETRFSRFDVTHTEGVLPDATHMLKLFSYYLINDNS